MLFINSVPIYSFDIVKVLNAFFCIAIRINITDGKALPFAIPTPACIPLIIVSITAGCSSLCGRPTNIATTTSGWLGAASLGRL